MLTVEPLSKDCRSLLIKSKLSINVPADNWSIAESIKEQFLAEHDESINSDILLFASLLNFTLTRSKTQFNQDDLNSFIATSFSDFEQLFASENDIHVSIIDLDKEDKSFVLRTYFEALVLLKKRGIYNKPPSNKVPAIFDAVENGSASISAIYGGQGNLEDYFLEIQNTYETYLPILKPFINNLSSALATVSRSDQAKEMNGNTIDLIQWLEKENTRPNTLAFAETDLSCPLIAVSQLLNYWILPKIFDISFSDLRKKFCGSTGHSQGIISSIVISGSSTEKEFIENSTKAVTFLYWLGLRSRNAFPITTIGPTILSDSLQNGEGVPSPMLSINGLPLKQIEKIVQETNTHLQESSRIYISLINGPRTVIISGPPSSLYGCNVALRKLKADSTDQSRIPFSQRKSKFNTRYLPVAVAFHSVYLKNVPSLLKEDAKKFDCSLDGIKLSIPVYDTFTGKDMTNLKDSLTYFLAEQITVLPVHWELATQHKVTHMVDFGPGSVNGIGALTKKLKDGRGVNVLLASTLESNILGGLLDKSLLFDSDKDSVKWAPDWVKEHRPRLVKISGTDTVHIDTKFSRLLGKPPLMVAGMTPCTVSEKFVSAVINAGYHVELAGGGQHSEQLLRDRVGKILEKIAPGEGITLNILFLNPRLWGFQYPATIAMRNEGIPMEGICIAAGVPSIDVADSVISNLKEAGIKHVSFKPGSAETIRDVIRIAKNHPDMPIILQWTGGRGGGHHSYEDFHQPLLETYGSIREAQNISLVIGSGFGDSEQAFPYFTGEWSEKLGYAPMPIDGVLFGSRVMVAKEALTSPAVKDLIVSTPGISNELDWEKTYKQSVGGIITVKSELGEPIHKIANRGMLLWKEIDETIFSLPKEKRVAALLKRKDYYIEKLNADFQKVWFGKKEDGSACELYEMTYSEVIVRLLDLLFVKHENRWIDVSLCETFSDFLKRVEERFTSDFTTPSLIQSSQNVLAESPQQFVKSFVYNFPLSRTQTLTQEDVYHFLTICSYPWRKPVPFIPIFDEKFEFWFKKDSLWQADDLEAVVDQDPQRVAILQGPVAVAHSTEKDVPVKKILDDIYVGLVSSIDKEYYSGKTDRVPDVEYLGVKPIHEKTSETLKGVVSSVFTDEGETSCMYELPRENLPLDNDYFDFIAGPKHSWLRAILCSNDIVQGHSLVDNPVRKLLRPRPLQTVIKSNKNGSPKILNVYEKSSSGEIPSRHPSVRIVLEENNSISVDIFEKLSNNEFVPLRLVFKYQRFQGYHPIHEVMEGRNQRIKDFYASLWGVKSTSDLSPLDTFRGTFEISKGQLLDFIHVIGNNAEAYLVSNEAPIDFGIVCGWKALVSATLPKEIDGDLLKLVHLSNEFRVLSDQILLPGDSIFSEASINSISINEMGKIVEIKAILRKQDKGEPVLQVVSKFLYRGKFSDYHTCFRRKVEKTTHVELKTNKDVDVLTSKEWFKLLDPSLELTPTSTLVFSLETFEHQKDSKSFAVINTIGAVYLKTKRETIEIAKINYQVKNAHGNIILEYLKRNGKPIEEEVFFKNGGYSILPDSKVYPALVTAHPNNKNYSVASGDYNPIHTNSYFADLAGLPSTITHGMWTSASTRKFVEIFAADNEPRRVKFYSVSFIAMVLPGDKLSTKLYHVGMTNGRKIIKVETLNQDGVKVLEGVAEVEQRLTSYVFTGQGSQEVGMGMELYSSSPVAKEVWDRADTHMLNEYGISLIEIVSKNPSSKTVYFGGKKGEIIRKNYRSLAYEIVVDGDLKTLPLFPEILEDSASYTFSHPNGLLSATQFTQPALTLMELSSFLDLKAKGLVQENCPFAGHSLGEYAALASVGEVLSVESLVDVVFYRGMTMQVAVPRDNDGRSDYGMVAVNPVRVGISFGERGLLTIVQVIAEVSSNLLEVVNYNVENFQYVVAGTLSNLHSLRLVLNRIKGMNIDFKEMVKSKSSEEIEEQLTNLVSECIEITKKSSNLAPERGVASIPLSGIDVPFHSSFLLNGVVPFREILKKKFEARLINVELLCDKYIPNLIAEPFSLSMAFVKKIHTQTGSTAIKDVLDNWDSDFYTKPDGKQQLGYILLIELLAYQFASPVRWVETQDCIFNLFQVERLVEIGPQPILSGMALRTLKIKYEKHDDAVTRRRVQLCISKHSKEIYYEFEDDINQEVASESSESKQSNDSELVEESARPMPSTPQLTKSAAIITDEAPTASEVLMVLVASKLKKSLADISSKNCIKDLVGGKSTLQNEILGDLASEFGGASLMEKAEELPLGEIAESIQINYTGVLGKISVGLINKLVSSKMPGGFGMSHIKNYLSSAFGLGVKRSEAVLLHGLTNEPSSRFTDEAAAKGWLNSISASYASKVGISFASQAANDSSAANAPVLNSEEFEKFKLKLDTLVLQQVNNLAGYLGLDLLEGSKTAASQKDELLKLQQNLDLWLEEHGEFYAEGIKPVFDPKKARMYDSYWNWVRQDALQLYYDLIFDKISNLNREIMNKCYHLMNRTDDYESMFQFMEYYLDQWPNKQEEKYERLRSLTKVLVESIKESIDADPVYRNAMYQSTAPKTSVSADGALVYSEVPRKSTNMLEYVNELRAGSNLTTAEKNELLDKFASIKSLLLKEKLDEKVKNEIDILFSSLKPSQNNAAKKPFISLKKRSSSDPQYWEYDSENSKSYLNILEDIASNGVSFKGKNVLVTGAGNGSIGVKVVQMLLSGGARVVVSTTRFNRSSTQFFKTVYDEHGAKGSCLVVVPFNGSSTIDIKNLVDYIYNALEFDLDFIIPFAAFPQEGREIDNIDSKCELAFRLMLTNVYRLIGEVKLKKESKGSITRPATVLLPLSPNHGTFGGDGLYGESKIALETLVNRFHSESWGTYLTIIGAVIGWTRGTGLMSANNIVAEGIEKLGARTFSQTETAFNIIGLLHPKIVQLSLEEPVIADLNGGLQFVKDLNTIVYDLRVSLLETAETRKAVALETSLDKSVLNGPNQQIKQNLVMPRANLKFSYPELKSDLKLSHLRGLLDLKKVVVCTGFGEVGPWGSSRTRWEMEAEGEFSLEGCIEMAWLMGFIRFHNGPLKKVPFYAGWVDSKTNEPVKDVDVKNKYESLIIKHAGIRLIEPELFDGYDPKKKIFLQEVVVVNDMPAIEVSEEDAAAFKLQHGEKASVTQKNGVFFVTIRKGASLRVPKALQFDRLVAGQIPTGWSAARYGVPEDIVKQVDPITLYALVATVEALVTSGITDPYEFYQYVHVSEVGITAGGGMGGMNALRKMFKERLLDNPVQNDILQESFINTMPAWINMLLLSSSGPIKTPVGACATAGESVEMAVDTIISGKAQVVICGGYDDFQEEGSYEFANMKATSSSTEEFAKGREPSEMCRPAADSRAGFMEAQGAGIHLVMTADLALKMGLPIRGIIASTSTATDKNGRSVPAPGQGLLTTARESKTTYSSPLLDIEYRSKQLKKERVHIKNWVNAEYESLKDEIEALKNTGANVTEFIDERSKFIEREGERKEKSALALWSHDFYKSNPEISPIRGALATYGLTIDDIGVASFHGTGTSANDYNESSVINDQFSHLGRTHGNVIPCVFQKHLTGHPKGAACAWMLNGVFQILDSGIIPGNRNCDNVDAQLEKFKYLLYPSKSVQTDGIKAALLKSFGFGQAGAEVLVIHPDYLFAALEEADFKKYVDLRKKRQTGSYRYFHETLTGKASFVQVKDNAPYTDKQQSSVYLNPLARASFDKNSNSWNFDPKHTPSTNASEIAKPIFEATSGFEEEIGKGVGIDVQLISEVNIENEVFIEKNFTKQEIIYCRSQPSPHSSFAGKWAGKEAVIKAISNACPGKVIWSGGHAAPLHECEINRRPGEAPKVRFTGNAKSMVAKSGIREEDIKITISHSGSYAVAMAAVMRR